jgi:WD40 repeat protein
MVLSKTISLPSAAYDAAWSPDGKAIAIVTDDALYIYSSDNYEEIMEAKSNAFYRLDWDPRKARFFVAGHDGLYNLEYDQNFITQHVYSIDGIPCWNAAVSPDGEYLAYSTVNPDSVNIGLASIDPLGTELMAIGPVAADGSRPSMPGGKVVILDLSTMNPIHSVDVTNNVHGLAWSPDGTKLAWTGEKSVIIYDMHKGTQVELKGEKYEGLLGMPDVAWSPDGTHLAAGVLQELTIWDLTTNQTQELEGYPKFIWSIDWSPDGRYLATGGDDRTIKIWDASTWKLVKTLQEHTDGIRGISWSPDGRRLASAGADNKVNIWEFTP